jgi:5-hydroxyisourate hydrolase-like protein (transthyretin family)
MKVSKLLISAMAITIISSVMANAAHAQGKHITVVIIDSITKKPILNGKIAISRLDKNHKPNYLITRSTDAAGLVVFTGLAAATSYEVTAEAPEYFPKKAYGTFGQSDSDYFIALKLSLRKKTDSLKK